MLCNMCQRLTPKNSRGKHSIYCDNDCKSQWQRTQKPVTKEWLMQKYVNEGLSTYEIGRLVNRNPKRVWEWLRGFDIPTRERTWDVTKSVLPGPEELKRLYESGLSSSEIATRFDVTEANVLHFLRCYDIARRSMKEIRAKKHWGANGQANPMFGRRGSLSTNWKGGATPLRQSFYSSQEWKQACRAVYRRDSATCQRCLVSARDTKLHVHHIVSFAYEPLRANPSNLTLLCNRCHRWVHSKKNVNKEWTSEIPSQV